MVEDFMLLKQNVPVIVLVPESHEIHFDKHFTLCGTITFDNNEYYTHRFTVHSNAKIDDVTSGIEVSELLHGIGFGNYGITMTYGKITDHHATLS